MALMTLLKDQGVKRGFQADPEREGSLEFGVSSIAGKDFIIFRIGRVVAQRAGLKVKDRVMLDIDRSGAGYSGALKPNPKGWSLQSADPKSENPALILRITWRDKWPYLDKLTACSDVIAKNHSLTFLFPEGTTLGKPTQEEVLRELDESRKKVEHKGEVPDGVLEEVYQEHKEIVERDLPRKKRKEDRPTRRESDKAPMMKNGRPYGRRKGDKI